jgi:CheY-like chemotaxis protein/two-component sensor histidine kinase
MPELQWARDVIDRQVYHMTRLVDDLLDLSRISRGKIELRKERIELASVLSHAVEASRPLVEKWGHELTVSLPPVPVYLEADPARIVQVLLNLLTNAAKYTDHGGHIWLTAEQGADEVLLRVKDNGIGIPAPMLPRLFDIFVQVEHTVDRAEGRLGIGLALVKRLVEMHGGTVSASSDGPGKGSEFVIRLPLAGPARAEVPMKSTRDGQQAPEQPPCRILVVDDNKDAADTLAVLLRLMGHDVHTAHDGLEAVGAATVLQPDVVLLDIGLPKLDGHQASRRIRQERGKNVVLIALTGWGHEEDRQRSKEAGFDYHLTKPVEIEELRKLLATPAASPQT